MQITLEGDAYICGNDSRKMYIFSVLSCWRQIGRTTRGFSAQILTAACWQKGATQNLVLNVTQPDFLSPPILRFTLYVQTVCWGFQSYEKGEMFTEHDVAEDKTRSSFLHRLFRGMVSKSSEDQVCVQVDWWTTGSFIEQKSSMTILIALGFYYIYL